ncbi:hypothetical protein ABC255_13395 [Neobacillus sp. 3P2-tot-E-2]|uniref:hypothetical protein n=1 Tax=Neobacillus sp. 3P2-tot-E-2 TaxID=3132212 RepID=UPI0039A24322
MFYSHTFDERTNNRANSAPANATIPPQKNACWQPSFRVTNWSPPIAEVAAAAMETKMAKPTADPTWYVVLYKPDARPDSSD